MKENFKCPIPCEGRGEIGPDGSAHAVYFPSCRPGDKVDSKDEVVCVPGVRWRCEARRQMLANQKFNELLIHASSDERLAQMAKRRGVNRAPTPENLNLEPNKNH